MQDLSQLKQSVGFLGAGNMATALIRGMVKAQLAPTRLVAFDIDDSKTGALESELGITRAATALELASRCSVVIIAVKPKIVPTLLQQLTSAEGSPLWISIAAGLSTGQLEEVLGNRARVVRAMPNTPALSLQGATGLCAGKHATGQDRELAQALLGAVGTTELIDESMMDALTGLSGSGPAYVMLMIEAMADGAVRAGLPRDVALRLAAQTVRGAATLVQVTGKHPGQLKDMVTSPGGTTIAGVASLEAHGFRNALISAVGAAAAQSKKLSQS